MADQSPLRPPPDPYRAILAWIETGRRFVAAVIVEATGSTPLKPGARAVIDRAGEIVGSLGGGAVEAEAERRAIEACRAGRSVFFTVGLEGDDTARDEPVCGGTVDVLIDVTAAEQGPVYTRVVEAQGRRERGLLCTSIGRAGTGEVDVTTRWVAAADLAERPRSARVDAMRASLDREQPRVIRPERSGAGSGPETFLEPVLPAPRLLIAGGGHVGRALAVQACLVGFAVTVLDDRPEFTCADRFPESVTTRCGPIAREVAASPIAEDTYVVIVTRGHRHDAEALRACLPSRAAYIGMIGSRRKVRAMRDDFLSAGLVTETDWNRIHAPVGLDIGAVSAAEIAASIVAQLVAVRRTGSGDRAPRAMEAG